jgi:hypothetical protein
MQSVSTNGGAPAKPTVASSLVPSAILSEPRLVVAIHGQNSRRAGGPLLVAESIQTAAEMSLRLNLSAAMDLIQGHAAALVAAEKAADKQ